MEKESEHLQQNKEEEKMKNQEKQYKEYRFIKDKWGNEMFVGVDEIGEPHEIGYGKLMENKKYYKSEDVRNINISQEACDIFNVFLGQKVIETDPSSGHKREHEVIGVDETKEIPRIALRNISDLGSYFLSKDDVEQDIRKGVLKFVKSGQEEEQEEEKGEIETEKKGENWPEILRAAADIHNSKYKESKEIIEKNKNKMFFNCPFCHRGEVIPKYKTLSSHEGYREEGDERFAIRYLAGLKCQKGDCGSSFSLEEAALLKERPDLFNKLWRWSEIQDSFPFKNKTGIIKRIYLSRANEIRNIPTFNFKIHGSDVFLYISKEDYAETGFPCPKKEGEEIEVTIPLTTVRNHTVFATKELRDRWEEKQALEKELIEVGLL